MNKTISRWRRIGRRERMLDDRNGLDCGPDGSGRDSSGSGGNGADLAAASTDAVLAQQLLISLPPRQRAAVSLRFFDDLPFGQIADILNCTESTARSYVHRALVGLRKQLSDTSAEQAGHV